MFNFGFDCCSRDTKDENIVTEADTVHDTSDFVPQKCPQRKPPTLPVAREELVSDGKVSHSKSHRREDKESGVAEEEKSSPAKRRSDEKLLTPETRDKPPIPGSHSTRTSGAQSGNGSSTPTARQTLESPALTRSASSRSDASAAGRPRSSSSPTRGSLARSASARSESSGTTRAKSQRGGSRTPTIRRTASAKSVGSVHSSARTASLSSRTESSTMELPFTDLMSPRMGRDLEEDETPRDSRRLLAAIASESMDQGVSGEALRRCRSDVAIGSAVGPRGLRRTRSSHTTPASALKQLPIKVTDPDGRTIGRFSLDQVNLSNDIKAGDLQRSFSGSSVCTGGEESPGSSSIYGSFDSSKSSPSRPSRTSRLKTIVRGFSKISQTSTAATPVVPDPNAFDSPDNAVIIFDWDDTLMPTTFISSVLGPSLPDLEKDQPLNQNSKWYKAMADHAQLVETALRTARRVARTAIVTLATLDWVYSSAARYLPGVDFESLVEELDIVVYPADRQSPALEVLARAGDDRGMVAKIAAMTTCLRALYASGDVSWNVTSIGDSVLEKEALKKCMSRHAHHLCKTVKLGEKPTLAELSREVRMLTPSLHKVVTHGKPYDGTPSSMKNRFWAFTM